MTSSYITFHLTFPDNLKSAKTEPHVHAYPVALLPAFKFPHFTLTFENNLILIIISISGSYISVL